MLKSLNKASKITLCIVAIILSLALLGIACFSLFVIGFNYNAKITYNTLNKIDSNNITIISCNVRCIAPQDLGQKSWFERAPRLMNVLANYEPDIICFQEVTKIHKAYIDNSLKGFDSVILYRENGLFAEGTPIYYNTNKFNLISKDGFWLSSTPDVMSNDWGAANYRVCSYVILEEKSTQKQFIVFNTHLDHVSELARVNGIELVMSKINEFSDLPSLLLGDFNDYIDSVTYDKAIEYFDNSRLIAVSADNDCMTYHGYGKENVENTAIDFCFVSKNKFNVDSYKVIKDKVQNNYISDHYPIKVVFSLK